MRRPDDDDTHGRVLLLIDSITDSWHSGPSRFGGTVVSFVMVDPWLANRAFADPHDLITAVRRGLRQLQHRHVVLDGCLTGPRFVTA